MSEPLTDEQILDMGAGPMAVHFHDTYERLAPEFDYKTRSESAVPWVDVPENQRRLMEATVRVVLRLTMARFDKDAATIDTLTTELTRYRSFVSWLDGVCVDLGNNSLIVESIRPAIARLNDALAAEDEGSVAT